MPYNPVFDYRLLRTLIGLVAIALPVIAYCLSGSDCITSISASYYTNSSDYFVGMLFIVGAFLLSYNGHNAMQSFASTVAGLGAFGIALFPTACDTCTRAISCTQCAGSITSTIHAISAAIMFGVLAYFCLGPFRAANKRNQGYLRRRAIYGFCGWLIIGALLTAILYNVVSQDDTSPILLYAETIALWAFGFAWFVSGKTLRIFTDDDERYRPFRHSS